MARLKNLQEPWTKAIRNRNTAAPPPEPIAPASPARRVTGFFAAVAGLAGIGALAGAMLVSPGAGPSVAGDAQVVSVAQGEGGKAAFVHAASRPEFVVAALPNRATKSDRLARWTRAPQPPAVDGWRKSDLLRRRPAAEEAAADDIVVEMLEKAIEAAPDSEPQPEAEPAASPVASGTGLEDGDDAVAATRSAPVTTDVNMRAGPDNAAAVITVVPASSVVEVIGCALWCEVIFDGERGWIYRSFVRGAQS